MKKKMMALLLSFVMTATMMPAITLTTFAEEKDSPDGSYDNPYVLTTQTPEYQEEEGEPGEESEGEPGEQSGEGNEEQSEETLELKEYGFSKASYTNIGNGTGELYFEFQAPKVYSKMFLATINISSNENFSNGAIDIYKCVVDSTYKNVILEDDFFTVTSGNDEANATITNLAPLAVEGCGNYRICLRFDEQVPKDISIAVDYLLDDFIKTNEPGYTYTAGGEMELDIETKGTPKACQWYSLEAVTDEKPGDTLSGEYYKNGGGYFEKIEGATNSNLSGITASGERNITEYRCAVTHEITVGGETQDVTVYLDYSITVLSAGNGTKNNPIQLYSDYQSNNSILRSISNDDVYPIDEEETQWSEPLGETEGGQTSLYFKFDTNNGKHFDYPVISIGTRRTFKGMSLYEGDDTENDLLNGVSVYKTEDGRARGETVTAKSFALEDDKEYTLVVKASPYDSEDDGDSELRITPYESTPCSANGHTYDSGKIIEQPSRENTGKVRYTCEICNEYYDQVIGTVESVSSIIDKIVSLENLVSSENNEYEQIQQASFNETNFYRLRELIKKIDDDEESLRELKQGLVYRMTEGGDLSDVIDEYKAIETGGHGNVVTNTDCVEINSILGATLNASIGNDSPQDVRLIVNNSSNEVAVRDIAESSNTVDKDKMVVLSMNLVEKVDGGEAQGEGEGEGEPQGEGESPEEAGNQDAQVNLTVPVIVNFDVPENINPEKLVVIHKSEGGATNNNEIIKPTINEDDGTATIAITSFSDFVIGESTDEDYKTNSYKPDSSSGSGDSGSGGSSNVDPTDDDVVDSGKEEGTVTADLSGETKVKKQDGAAGALAETNISQETAKQIADAAKKNKSTEILIEAKVDTKENVVASNVSIPVTIVDAANDNGASIKIETNTGSMTVDADTAKALSETGADSVTFSIERTDSSTEDKIVYEINLNTIKDEVATPVTSLGGKMNVAVDVPEAFDGKTPVVLCINGKTVELISSKVENGKLIMTLEHLSTYAIMSEENAEKTIKEGAEATTMGTLSLKSYKNGKIKAAWKNGVGNTDSIVRYQIYRANDRKFKKGLKKYTTAKKSYTMSKSLKKGKKYYVKVRARIKINGKTYYSKWSSVKSIKCRRTR